MSDPRLDVELCVVTATTHQHGSHAAYNLLGVEFLRTYSPDVEFPRTIGRLDVFTRFFVSKMTQTTIAIRIWWLKPDGTNRQRVNQYFFDVPFQVDETWRERVFRLVNVHIPGEGDYAVRVCGPAEAWKKNRWRVLATDYFRVVKL